ncbi:MAG: glycosyltransferase family 2 protein [Clostridia bacterium]|nr:glycosyltransferase family 2 protein [Clostridia bacterium]
MCIQSSENPLITVVIPIYKVEKYIRRCVESVLAQTYKNLEIILVDDGSPDNCPRICDEYAENDARVKVIHRENGGLSAARNSGIKIAQGEYISFIDSDDYVSPLYIEQLYIALAHYDAAISECSYSHNETELDTQIKSDFKLYNDKEALTEILIERDLITSACCKLFLTELFKTIQFPEGKLYEDYAVMPMLFNKAKKISFVNSKLYFYRVNEESITKCVFNEKHMQYFEIADGVNEYIEKNYPDLLKHSLNRDTSMAIAYFRKICRSGYSGKAVVDELVTRIKKGAVPFLKSHYPPFKKLAAIVISVSPAAAKRLMK